MPRILTHYADLFDALEKSFVEKIVFQSHPDFVEVMKEPRLLVAISHSTPLSWLPAIAVLGAEAIKAGGGDRTPQGVMDRWFYSNPLTKWIAEFLTQSDHPQTFDELLEHFAESERSDLVIFPEGANTFFGDVSELGDFRSYRFVELAIRSESPILLVVHKGSENWSRPLQLPPELGALILPISKFFGQRILGGSTLNFPQVPQKLPLFQMSCELYWPSLKAVEFSSDPEDAKKQLQDEAEKVRLKMQDMLSQLK